VPQGHNVFRYSNSDEFFRLLDGGGLTDVKVTQHATTYLVPDTETLWRGGLGSLVLTGAVIRTQDRATQESIRTSFERYANVYRSADGLTLPISLKLARASDRLDRRISDVPQWVKSVASCNKRRRPYAVENRCRRVTRGQPLP
jgi:hypothetical protein